MNNLEKHLETVSKWPRVPMPTGSALEVGEALLQNCRERDARLAREAIEAERGGDEDGCWLAMASRAENKRVMDKIQRDVDKLRADQNDK